MTESVMPEIQAVSLTANYGKFVLEPLERGFGVTLGNAMRRVLLNSLPGYAVTSVKIEDVQHEYSAVKHMKEDVIEFLLNVKGIRLKPVVPQTMPVTMRLDWTGEGEVHAGDIQRVGEYEIVNPDLVLGTLDNPEARLSAEFEVEQGVGYRSAGGAESETIGQLPLDAVFTPIRKVNFEVEHTRVGQITNYDRLVLEIWTDDTIGPKEAASQTARILVQYLSLIVNLDMPVVVATPGPRPMPDVPDEIYNMSIEELKLSSRTLNCLRRGTIHTVGEVLERTEAELLALRNFGERSLRELYGRLQSVGVPIGARGDGEEASDEDGIDDEEEEAVAEIMTAYSSDSQEEQEEEVPPSVGRTFYPD